VHPAMPEGSEEGILKGMYLLKRGFVSKSDNPIAVKVQLLGSGTILNEHLAAQALLEKDFGISADVWSVTSFTELRREGLDIERFNNLDVGLLTTPTKESYVTTCFANTQGPIIAATDYVKLYADQIRFLMPKGRSYICLGTDGFGRSDTREVLRNHFEVNRYFIAYTAIKALVDEGILEATCAQKALILYSIHSDKPDPSYA
jgi:pyruvate dehydrogenase E1 component